jgi:hypothetical protein
MTRYTGDEPLSVSADDVLSVGQRDPDERIAELEQQLWLLLGDAKARAVSCTCYPPLTKHETYHIERAEALLAGYEPKTT